MKKMNRHTKNAAALILFMCSLLSMVTAQSKNASPYFVVLSDENKEAQLPLKSTKVDVTISGVIADVTVNQVYTNTGKSTIEAIYIFPASTRAAVYDVTMKVGYREIVAKIEEKNKALNIYNTAKKEGKTASLLEQEEPNVFKMNVANIVPGATVEVKLSYTELLIPTDKIYEFVYPTVVGPRYVSPSELKSQTKEAWTGNPYLTEGTAPTSTLDIQMNINTGIPIQEIRCETHKNQIEYLNKTNATLTLKEPKGGNRDFVAQYRLAGNKIETGILLYDNPNGEKYFLAMMQPPASVEPKTIPAREYVFIVDVSGSMYGFPLSISKQLMRDILGKLKETDLFNIVFFSGGSYIYNDKSLPATAQNIDEAISFMDNNDGSGGTELLCALKAAMTLNKAENYARSFVILTDGYVSVEDKTFDYIRENLGDANFFAFGIGEGVNRYIIEGMAHVGYGEPFIAINQTEAVKEAEKFQKYISQPVLTNIKYSFENFDAYNVLPEKIPDLFAERPIIISGKYRGDANGLLKISGTTGKGEITQSIKIKGDQLNNKALKYLWAREKIRLLGDYASLGEDSWSSTSVNKAKIITEITELGLKYNLLTKYTSFIAVDSVVSNPTGNQTTIQQPLPLPSGVSNLAIGENTSTESNVIENNIEINEELDLVSESDDETVVSIANTEVVIEEEETDSPVFIIVETMPEFPGGFSALQQNVAQTIQYPVTAQENGIQGRVFVSFVVDTLGNITNAKVIRGIDPTLDAEAIRVVMAMPKWKPGIQRGKKVNVSYVIPINFSLQGGSGIPAGNISTPTTNQPQPVERKRHPYQVPPC